MMASSTCGSFNFLILFSVHNCTTHGCVQFGMTVLHCAASYGDRSTVETLVVAGAVVNVANNVSYNQRDYARL